MDTIQSESLATRLTRLGLTAAAHDLDKKRMLAKKLDRAYRDYRFVEQEKITQFNNELMNRTFTPVVGQLATGTYETLSFTPLDQYPSVPPTDVLTALESAMEAGCFDTFEVAQITVQSIPKPDPILFGRITGCTDRFFIAQWDDDVKIEDLLQGDEGYIKAGHLDGI